MLRIEGHAGTPPKYQGMILEILSAGPLKHGDIMNATGINSGSVTYALRSLEKKGMVERESKIRECRYGIILNGALWLKNKWEGEGRMGGEWSVERGISGAREPEEKLTRLLEEISNEVYIYAQTLYASKPKPVQEAYAISMRNRIVEKALNDAWNPYQFLIWWKTKQMTWAEGDGLFRINNAPTELRNATRRLAQVGTP